MKKVAMRRYFCNWFLQAVHDSVVDSRFMFFTLEAWFYMSGCISTQNNRYWSSFNLRQTSEVPLLDQKIGVWCSIIAT
jgi:hypothetical protein